VREITKPENLQNYRELVRKIMARRRAYATGQGFEPEGAAVETAAQRTPQPRQPQTPPTAEDVAEDHGSESNPDSVVDSEEDESMDTCCICHQRTVLLNRKPMATLGCASDGCVNECHVRCALEPVREDDGKLYLDSFEAPPGYEILPKPQRFITSKELQKDQGKNYLVVRTNCGEHWWVVKIKAFFEKKSENFHVYTTAAYTPIIGMTRAYDDYHVEGAQQKEGGWAYMKKQSAALARGSSEGDNADWLCPDCQREQRRSRI